MVVTRAVFLGIEQGHKTEKLRKVRDFLPELIEIRHKSLCKQSRRPVLCSGTDLVVYKTPGGLRIFHRVSGLCAAVVFDDQRFPPNAREACNRKPLPLISEIFPDDCNISHN